MRSDHVTRVTVAESSPADIVDFFLEGESIQGRKGKTEKQADPSVQEEEGVAESPLHFFSYSVDSGRIGIPQCAVMG